MPSRSPNGRAVLTRRAHKPVLADLLHHLQSVRLAPAFDDPSVLDAENVDAREPNLLAGGWNAQLISLVSAGCGPPHRHPVTGGDDIVGAHAQVGKHGVVDGDELLDAVQPGPLTR